MPNHCQNTLTVRGDKKVVEKFIKDITVGTHEFSDVQNEAGLPVLDLNTLYPVPEELQNTQSPPNICEGEEYEKAVADYEKSKEENNRYGLFSRPITPDESDSLIDKYGTNNWFDWCVSEWGSKWGAYDIYLFEEDDTKDGEKIIVLGFTSAWSPPIHLIERISENYQELHFRLDYYEGGCFFCGTHEVKKGRVLSECYHEDDMDVRLWLEENMIDELENLEEMEAEYND